MAGSGVPLSEGRLRRAGAMIFVTVGTERFPFDRLVKGMDEAAERLKGEPVFMQLGEGGYLPKRCGWTHFLSYVEFVEKIREARIIVSHAGAGSILTCKKLGKVPIVMPRLKEKGEHIDDHQVELARRMADLGHVLLAREAEEILPLIQKFENQEPSFPRPASSRSPLIRVLSDYLSQGPASKKP